MYNVRLQTCFRSYNSMPCKFMITRQNAPEYAISRHRIQTYFYGEGTHSPRPIDRRAFGT